MNRITYSPQMVLAKLALIKTETRRLRGLHHLNALLHQAILTNDPEAIRRTTAELERVKNQYPFGPIMGLVAGQEAYATDGDRTLYAADADDMAEIKERGLRVLAGMYMPISRCRIFDRLVSCRVERLAKMTHQSALAEGFGSVKEFMEYWDLLNNKPCKVLGGSARHQYPSTGSLGTLFRPNGDIHIIPGPFVYVVKTLPATRAAVESALGYEVSPRFVGE